MRSKLLQNALAEFIAETSAINIHATKPIAATPIQEKRGRYLTSSAASTTHATTAISTKVRKKNALPEMNGKK